jgi:hypothetical protein
MKRWFYGIMSTQLKITLFGELSLEEAIDLSRDRQILGLICTHMPVYIICILVTDCHETWHEYHAIDNETIFIHFNWTIQFRLHI